MRLRHIMSETASGLRQNTTMTLAVVMTMWVSLSLFGLGLLANQQVDLMKGRWYDKIEISVFLCTKDTPGANCRAGHDITPGQKEAISQTLRSNPEVAAEGVFFETKAMAYAEFQSAYKGNPIQATLTENQMQESFRVKLKNPETYQGVVRSVAGLNGVQNVRDLRQYLDPFFQALRVVQWATIAASALLLLAASLQIGNLMRLATFARRREIGIMRLVGASNAYITLPFLLSALASAFLGIVLSGLTLASVVHFLILGKAEIALSSLPWIGWHQAALALAGVAVVGILLAVVPTLLTTRKYLRV